MTRSGKHGTPKSRLPTLPTHLGNPFGSLFEPAEAIEKLLRCAKRSVVQFLEALQQLEAHAKLGVQRFSIVANNLKSAAFQRTFRAECADEHVAARFDRMRNLANISGTLIGC